MDEERKLFEAWYSALPNPSPLTKSPGSRSYEWASAYTAWMAWQAALAARQPVGEPVGEVFWDNETGEISVNWLNGDLPPGIGTLLYDIPPAQTVDLGQFLPVVEAMVDTCGDALTKEQFLSAGKLLNFLNRQA